MQEFLYLRIVIVTFSVFVALSYTYTWYAQYITMISMHIHVLKWCF